jgi:hypothetical protein
MMLNTMLVMSTTFKRRQLSTRARPAGSSEVAAVVMA